MPTQISSTIGATQFMCISSPLFAFLFERCAFMPDARDKHKRRSSLGLIDRADQCRVDEYMSADSDAA
jgi:hypothetical protein